MLLKKSAMGRRRATIESRAMTSRIELARSVVVLNQYCSEDPLKILFQQHRPEPDIAPRGPASGRPRFRHLSSAPPVTSGGTLEVRQTVRLRCLSVGDMIDPGTHMGDILC